MIRTSPVRLAFLVALLCAMSLRLLTPPGWMPSPELRTGVPLVICTGDGAHPAKGGQEPHAPAKDGHEVCAFAGFALVEPPAAPLLLARQSLPAAALATSVAADQVSSAPDSRRPQAPRAPPLLA